jgi:hypothetical protein
MIAFGHGQKEILRNPAHFIGINEFFPKTAVLYSQDEKRKSRQAGPPRALERHNRLPTKENPRKSVGYP